MEFRISCVLDRGLLAFSQILTQNLTQRRCSKWFIDYIEENKKRLGVGRSWEAGDSRLLPSVQAGIILQALCFGGARVGAAVFRAPGRGERGWPLPWFSWGAFDVGHSFCRMLGYQPNGAESTGSSPGDPHLDSVTGLGYVLKFGRQGLWHLSPL